MKSMKKEFIIFGVIIIALLGYLVFRKTDILHYKIPKLEIVKIEDIDKIEIKKAGNTIQFVKKDTLWVLSPQGYSADAEKVKELAELVSKLKITDLASKSKNYALYELDSQKAVHVKAFQKDKVLREFEVGKVAPTYSHTFVKIKDDENIYYALDSFREKVDLKTDDFRNKLVMKFDIDEISEVEIEKDGNKIQFVKNAKPGAGPTTGENDPKGLPGNIEWVTPDGKKAVKATMDSLIGQLADLYCEGYAEGSKKDDFKGQQPICALKLKGNRDYMISLLQKIETAAGENASGEAKYLAISSENPYPFYMASWKADQVMKKPEDLLEKEAKKVEVKKNK